MKRTVLFIITFGFVMGVFATSVYACEDENWEDTYQCEITINANTDTAEDPVIMLEGSAGCPMGQVAGFYDVQGFKLSGSYTNFVHDGQIVNIGPCSNLLIHTIDKKKPVVKTKTETKTKSIDFDTIRKNDSTLKKGDTKVAQNGKKGERTITYEVTYTDGKETGRKKVGNKVTTKPVNKIILVGTKVETSKKNTNPEKDKPNNSTTPPKETPKKNPDGNTQSTHHSSTTTQDTSSYTKGDDTNTSDNDTNHTTSDNNERKDDNTSDEQEKSSDDGTKKEDENKQKEDGDAKDNQSNDGELTSDSSVKGELDTHTTSRTTVASVHEKESGESSSSISWWIGGIIVIIALGGIGYWLYTRYKKE